MQRAARVLGRERLLQPAPLPPRGVWVGQPERARERVAHAGAAGGKER
eukprot:CAMPEP_0202800506 /NCGR_PEP_ID=MMETSP1388-20130828/100556_1 /ASSEMBLY_ACC=CAM_ASM_000864 /TAXON_ID=37098 /ORGANISM="Isochrysis sp, Strain CCMP1244" /LENGTH=47 /DNA_ID= /DNA_START= /DNA_END= /DNA_ORIENTATION=